MTPVGMHYLLIHFDVPETDDCRGRSRSRARSGAARALDDRPPRPSERDVPGDDGVRRERSRAPVATADLAAVADGGHRHGRVDRDALRPLLEEAGIRDEAVELVFAGADQGIQGEVEQNTSAA